MVLLMYSYFLAFVLIITIEIATLCIETYGQQPGKLIGNFYECAHRLKGKVFAKNDREIIIQGFHYDGSGPAAWFHAMRKGIKGGAHTSEPSYYYTLPYPNGNCGVLFGNQFQANGKKITLTLPVSIKELETIGMYCYRYCHNFGYVEIPKDLEVPPAPTNLVGTKPCPNPSYSPCFSKGRGPAGQESKQGGPNCSPVGPGPSPSPPPVPPPPSPGPSPVPVPPRSPISPGRPPPPPPGPITKPPIKPPPPPQPQPTPEPESKGISIPTPVMVGIIIAVVIVVVVGSVIGWRTWCVNRVQDAGEPFRVVETRSTMN